MAKQKKPIRRLRNNKNHKNGNGIKNNVEAGEKFFQPEELAQDSSLKTEEKNKLDILLDNLRAGKMNSDENLMLLFGEYEKIADGDNNDENDENEDSEDDKLPAADRNPEESDAAQAEIEKLNRYNEQLHNEINILKNELENMKQSRREQDALQKLVEEYQTALVEKDSLLQELDQRLQFLSHQLQDIPLISAPAENANYRITRAQMLANTILPNFYKKRLSMELNLFEEFEADAADARLIELNLMRELIHYHETELKQLLKN